MSNTGSTIDELKRAIEKYIEASSTGNESESPEYQAETTALDHAKAKAEVASLEQDRIERKTYANRAFWVVIVWLSFIAALLCCEGFKRAEFSIDNDVLKTLIGSTTAGVIGLFWVVTRYLFPRR